MYCANCGKTFVKRELITYTVMPGWSKPVPTCYHDRLCYAKTKALPAVLIKLVVHKSVVVITPCKPSRGKSRGLDKYLRRQKFYRRGR